MKRQAVVLFYILSSIVLNLNVYPQEVIEIKQDDPAPTFFLRTIEGKNFFLSKEIKPDSLIILAFYATWCVPCRQEIPALEKMMIDPTLNTARLYYVNVGGLMADDENGDVVMQREQVDNVLRHKERFNITHPILMDRYAVTAQKFGAESLPTIVVIGGDGKIKYSHHGYLPGDEEMLLKLLLSL